MRSVYGISLAATIGLATSLSGATLLSPTDVIYGVDRDVGIAPTVGGGGSEGPANILDGNAATKYLSSGNNWSGFIVTPGSSVVQSMRLTTANDAVNRDPAYYVLYGTTDPISSASQSRGTAENWTVISSGSVALPTARQDATTVVDIPNSASYTSYKLLFPQTRSGGDASMQIADVQFYSGTAGGGSSILSVGNSVIPVDYTGAAGSSRYPVGERPMMALDGSVNTKYLNFGGTNAGFIITPSLGPTIIQSVEVWSANDAPERDPVSFSLYGYNGTVSYNENSTAEFENWTFIGSGNFTSMTNRFTSLGVADINATEAYDSYLWVATGLRGLNGAGAPATPNSVQFSEIQFYGTVVPEPSTFGLLSLGLGGILWMRRKKK